jgi:hypothetical protein
VFYKAKRLILSDTISAALVGSSPRLEWCDIEMNVWLALRVRLMRRPWPH